MCDCGTLGSRWALQLNKEYYDGDDNCYCFWLRNIDLVGVGLWGVGGLFTKVTYLII